MNVANIWRINDEVNELMATGRIRQAVLGPQPVETTDMDLLWLRKYKATSCKMHFATAHSELWRETLVTFASATDMFDATNQWFKMPAQVLGWRDIQSKGCWPGQRTGHTSHHRPRNRRVTTVSTTTSPKQTIERELPPADPRCWTSDRVVVVRMQVQLSTSLSVTQVAPAHNGPGAAMAVVI
ncbi:hypothetical protein RI367_002898 [Sorochytrium milnesiophthora]